AKSRDWRYPAAHYYLMWFARTSPLTDPGSAPGHRRNLGHPRVVLAAPVRDVLEPEEVQLDGEPVGIGDEDLVQVGFRQRARPDLDSPLLETPDERPRLAGQEGDVVDDTRVILDRALRRAQVVEVRVVDAVRPHVDLDLAIHPEPVAREGEVRPRHHLEA